MKPTYNPSKIRRARKFGFRKRNQTSAGRKVLKNRRRKGRAHLTASGPRRFRWLFVSFVFLETEEPMLLAIYAVAQILGVPCR